MMKFPKPRLVMPAELIGQDNGNINLSLMVDVGFGPFKMYHKAAVSFRKMREDAAGDGVYLSATGAYRNYDQQVALFRQRFTLQNTGRTSRVWQGQRWYLKPRVALAAVPGTSNHGWGLAIDVALDADNDLEWEWPPSSIDRRALDWLLANADDYGWGWELDSEPWHLRYYVGDATPRALRPTDYPFVDPTVIGEFEMNIVSPTRVYDSRRVGSFAAGETRSVRVGDHAAVFVNVTAVSAKGDGFVTVWGGGPRPDVSNLNYGAGDTICNTSWVPVVDGHIQVFTFAACDLIVDLQATG
jgi:hypothetical protein